MAIQDRLASKDFDRIASLNYADFLDLKHSLVSQRRENCTVDDVAEFLGTTPEAISQFEAYDYDPKASEIRDYALAIQVVIRSTAKTFEPPTLDTVWNMWDVKNSKNDVQEINLQDVVMNVTTSLHKK